MKKRYFIPIAFFLLILNCEAQVTVTLPEILTSDPPGATVEIPVLVGDLTGLGVTAYQFVFHYDHTLLTPKSPYFSTDGTLSGETGMLVMTNPDIPDKVSIAAAGSMPLAGTGTLLYLLFEIASTEGSCPLTLTDFYFNAGTPQANLVNGSFTISSCIPQQQYLLIPPGWSGISSYLTPVNSNMVTMFAPVVDNLIMVTDYAFSNQYSPPNSILPIEPWDASQGYFIKMNTETVFVLSGCETAQKTIALSAGWNLVPVISNDVFILDEILTGMDFEIVQEAATSNIYWPSMAIQTLYFFEPGKAYLIKMNSPGVITFP